MKSSFKLLVLIMAIIFALPSCNSNNEVYDASGTFEATEVTISAEAQGRILNFTLEEGDTLHAGQLVGLIDTTQLSLKRDQLLSSIKGVKIRKPEIKTQIAVLEQQIATQEYERARVKRLVEANAANRKQLDDIDGYISLLKAQLKAQNSSLAIAASAVESDAATLEIQVEQTLDMLKRSQIVNPTKGVVLNKFAEANELAAPGKPLYKVADIDQMTLRAYLTSEQITKIKLGDKVKVITDFGNKYREYNGEISWISAKAEFTPKNIHTKSERDNLVYAIKVSVANDGYIKIGMYGMIRLN